MTYQLLKSEPEVNPEESVHFINTVIHQMFNHALIIFEESGMVGMLKMY